MKLANICDGISHGITDPPIEDKMEHRVRDRRRGSMEEEFKLCTAGVGNNFITVASLVIAKGIWSVGCCVADYKIATMEHSSSYVPPVTKHTTLIAAN